MQFRLWQIFALTALVGWAIVAVPYWAKHLIGIIVAVPYWAKHLVGIGESHDGVVAGYVAVNLVVFLLLVFRWLPKARRNGSTQLRSAKDSARLPTD
jgi:hypothetical protein